MSRSSDVMRKAAAVQESKKKAEDRRIQEQAAQWSVVHEVREGSVIVTIWRRKNRGIPDYDFSMSRISYKSVRLGVEQLAKATVWIMKDMWKEI